ncbi:MAG: FkbM family methyltransferase [Candidatus Marinimicrobia bacterium]|nr:FkbM family methyltransferase [Candidatus Neomarinimicrobiota bacterium]
MKLSLSPEKWMSEILKKILNYSDGTFLDIGVNLGQTLIKLKSIEPTRDYIGIEPNPSCIFYLQHLVSSNQWQNIKLIPTGLYTVDCLLSLVGGKDTDPASTIIHEFKISSQENSRVLKLVPLLSFSTIQKSIPHQNISIIKIDTEGAEFEVMESLTKTIQSSKPIINGLSVNLCKQFSVIQYTILTIILE